MFVCTEGKCWTGVVDRVNQTCPVTLYLYRLCNFRTVRRDYLLKMEISSNCRGSWSGERGTCCLQEARMRAAREGVQARLRAPCSHCQCHHLPRQEERLNPEN